jgi:hypothetical protein
MVEDAGLPNLSSPVRAEMPFEKPQGGAKVFSECGSFVW